MSRFTLAKYSAIFFRNLIISMILWYRDVARDSIRLQHAEKSCMTSCPRATQEGYVYPLPLPLWLYLEFNMRESVNLLPLLFDTSHRWIHTNPVPPIQASHALRACTLLLFFITCFWATTVLQKVALWLVTLFAWEQDNLNSTYSILYSPFNFQKSLPK